MTGRAGRLLVTTMVVGLSLLVAVVIGILAL